MTTQQEFEKFDASIQQDTVHLGEFTKQITSGAFKNFETAMENHADGGIAAAFVCYPRKRCPLGLFKGQKNIGKAI